MADMHFRIFRVEDDTPIQEFVDDKGLTFKKGRGYYQLTEPETIKAKKSFLLIDRLDGELFEDDEARLLLGAQAGQLIKIASADLDRYLVFVQSSSANRKLAAGTRFLYAMDEQEAEWLRKMRAAFIDYINNVIFDRFNPRRERFRGEMLEYVYRKANELEVWRLEMIAQAELFPNLIELCPEKLCGYPLGSYQGEDEWEVTISENRVDANGRFSTFATQITYADGEIDLDIEID